MSVTSHRSPVNPYDLANLDSLLTKDEIAVRSSVRELFPRPNNPICRRLVRRREKSPTPTPGREGGAPAVLGWTPRATAVRG